MNLLEKDTNYTAIQSYLKEGGATELTKVQEDLLARYITAHELFLKKNSDFQVANELKVRFGVSVTTGYRDIKVARNLFGTGNPLNKEYCAKLLWEWSLEELRLASRAHDRKATAAHLKNMINICKEMKVESQDLEELFNNFNITITAKPEDIGLEPVTIEAVDALLIEYNERKRLSEPESRS